MKPVWLMGAGGHARVLIDGIRSEGQWEIVGALDDDESRWGGLLDRVPILGGISVDSIVAFKIKHAVIAIGDNATRAAIARRFHGLVGWAIVVHPRAYVASQVTMEEGTVVMAGAVIQPGSRIGRHVIVNTSSSVDHGDVLGDFVHVAPGAHLSGDVIVEEGALIGLGAAVLGGKRVGRWATLGAGAVATADVAAGAVAVGVPARTPLREPSCPTD